MPHSQFPIYVIDLSGRVTDATALASLTAHETLETHSLAEAFPLKPERIAQLQKWLELIEKRHHNLRWEKILPLAPAIEVSEGNADVTGPNTPIKLGFHPLYDKAGKIKSVLVLPILPALPTLPALSALSAETKNKTSAESIQNMIESKNKLETRDVLALAANPPETLGAFLDDAGIRLERSEKNWNQFQNPWNSLSIDSTPESIGQSLFRDLHMIKGNAGAFGFDGLAQSSQIAEDLLETLKTSEEKKSAFGQSLSDLRIQFEEIRRALKLIAGEGQEAMSRILKWKMDRLIKAASEIENPKRDPALQNLIDSTKRLPYLSPAYLARKYRNLVERLSLNQGKKINFRITSNTGDIHPECFSRVDEALVHILRNMVDHGIETPSEREKQGKGDAQIGMEYITEEDRIFIRMVDDGRGMEPATIASRGIHLGLITQKAAELLDDTGKLGLIFQEGFTTRDDANLISGRGLGLALAARCVQDQGGNIYVYAKLGEGARFAIELPHIGTKKLPS